eukprot:6077095-Pyramimonas_sp.AAC.1
MTVFICHSGGRHRLGQGAGAGRAGGSQERVLRRPASVARCNSQSALLRAARGARSLRSENKGLGSKSDRNLIGPCLSLRCSG